MQEDGNETRYPASPSLYGAVVCLHRHGYVRLDAPGMVSLFVYDNDKFIVESFAEEPAQARIVTDKRIARLRDMETGQELTGLPQGNTNVFETPLTRGTYRVFTAQ
jgi:hypothetical protein